MGQTADQLGFGIPVGRVDVRPDLDVSWTPAPIAPQAASRRYLIIVLLGVALVVVGVVSQIL